MIELFIHLLQPYPYIQIKFEILILGNNIIYSFNTIMYCLAVLRFYIVIKLVKFWNLYSSRRARNIQNFLGIDTDPSVFLYKTNLKARSFLSLAMIGFSLLYLASLVFKVFEYTKVDHNAEFYYFWNSIWFLLITMTTSIYIYIIL